MFNMKFEYNILKDHDYEFTYNRYTHLFTYLYGTQCDPIPAMPIGSRKDQVILCNDLAQRY
jgi:hypothetical protein